MSRPIRWTPELVNRNEADLWCLLRWAVREEEMFLCGVLEVEPWHQHSDPRDATALGFGRQDAGGLAALFESREDAAAFVGGGGVSEGPGIAVNHVCSLDAMRFDLWVRRPGNLAGRTNCNLHYFDAIRQLGTARMIVGPHAGAGAYIELAETIRRKWTISEFAQHVQAVKRGLPPGWISVLPG